jgi:hypothetical protein
MLQASILPNTLLGACTVHLESIHTSLQPYSKIDSIVFFLINLHTKTHKDKS